jgi:hypothetical protein
MTRNAVEHLIVKKFTGGWHVWEGGGRLRSRWLSAHKTQGAAFAWALGYVSRGRVHNHPPYEPMCNERRLPGGQLRGACLNDDASDRDTRFPPVSEGGGSNV